MPFSLRRCPHDVRQSAEHIFECLRCGTMFVSVNRNNPNLGRIIDSLNRTHSFPDTYLDPHTGHTVNSMNVDLGPIPEDIHIIKDKMDDMEKTLLIFSEILKDALQS